MSTYAIGDVQGCYAELQLLLEKINYNSENDALWFAGDLVNRGPKSLEVLRFVKKLKNTTVVLGNHDLHLVALAHGADDYDPATRKYLDDILNAHDCDELIDWLCQQPLMHYDSEKQALIAHAGVYPFWTLEESQSYAHEAETLLKSDARQHFFEHMYGDEPMTWSDDLKGEERIRFIINTFTRMRLVSKQGELELKFKNKLKHAPEHYEPWFNLLDKSYDNVTLIFGHWAALDNIHIKENIFGIDTGCVWGNALTALRLEDRTIFKVDCHE